jgi:hypothetical protein
MRVVVPPPTYHYRPPTTTPYVRNASALVGAGDAAAERLSTAPACHELDHVRDSGMEMGGAFVGSFAGAGTRAQRCFNPCTVLTGGAADSTATMTTNVSECTRLSPLAPLAASPTRRLQAPRLPESMPRLPMRLAERKPPLFSSRAQEEAEWYRAWLRRAHSNEMYLNELQR